MAFTKLNPATFAGTGLDFTSRERRPRVICSNDGRDKSGKSDFCYDAPDPIAVLSFDFGDEDVVQKYTDPDTSGRITVPRQIVIKDLKWEIPSEYRSQQGTAEKSKSDQLGKWVDEQVWTPFVKLTKKIIESGMFRTVVVDKATEAWQVCRLGVYGRLASNRQDLQTEANARWREYVRLFASSELPINLHLIHEQKEEWVSKGVDGGEGEKKDKWFKSGVWVRDGNDKVPFLIQVGLEHRFIQPKKHPVSGNIIIEPGFECEVKVNRSHPELVGTTFTSVDGNLDWLTVMSTLRPEIPIEEWGHANLR